MKMGFSISLRFVFLCSLLWAAATAHKQQTFLQCLSDQIGNTTTVSRIVYTPANPSFLSVLRFSIQNLRFSTPQTPLPLAIVTPLEESHVQGTMYCSRTHDIQLRVRSGGHDYEGLSFVSRLPFVIVDMINMTSITVDVEERTAWLQAGATLGELYYNILNKSRTLAFPAGICPSVGAGGHISGGGYGILLRRYGLAADHVVDARLVDVNGRILDRSSMGEDLFWAIRGGGGSSFGVILAWKVELITVPENVTVFTISRTLDQNATDLVLRWQSIADKIDDRLFMRVIARPLNLAGGGRTIQVSFLTLYLGEIDSLLQLIQSEFPELGLARENCTRMRWIESFAYFYGLNLTSLEELLNRDYNYRSNYKIKADYMEKPIPKMAFEEMWTRFQETDIEDPLLVLTPYGGRMSQISESSLPFPHRAGLIYQVEYQVRWTPNGTAAANRHISWIRSLYKYMAPFASKNPREAYINYRDLDVGMNDEGNTSYAKASIWGKKYFKNNFDRLVYVKTMVDPGNFLRNEQSIPPLSPWAIDIIGSHYPERKDSM